eukprot:456506-Amphidinium_carterae.1
MHSKIRNALCCNVFQIISESGACKASMTQLFHVTCTPCGVPSEFEQDYCPESKLGMIETLAKQIHHKDPQSITL